MAIKNSTSFRHGHASNYGRTPTYVSWKSMISRCFHLGNGAYKDYGAKGITVCHRWRSFLTFLADMGEKPTPRHTLDRIANNGNYEPGNCRWATLNEQARNKSNNAMLTYGGVTKPIADWADEVGLKAKTIKARLTRFGWSIEKALYTKPLSIREVSALGHAKRWAQALPR